MTPSAITPTPLPLKEDFAEAYNNRAVAYFYLKEYAKGLADVTDLSKTGRPAGPEVGRGAHSGRRPEGMTGLEF